MTRLIVTHTLLSIENRSLFLSKAGGGGQTPSEVRLCTETCRRKKVSAKKNHKLPVVSTCVCVCFCVVPPELGRTRF